VLPAAAFFWFLRNENFSIRDILRKKYRPGVVQAG
jgi:hypothetical protein